MSNGMGNTWASTIDNTGSAEFNTIKLGGTFTATAVTQDELHTAISNSDTNTYYGAHVLRLIPQVNKIKVTASYDSAIGASLTAKNSNGNIIAGAVMPQSKEVYLTFSTTGTITITTGIDGIDIAITQTFSDYGNDVTVALPLPAYGYCIDEDNSDPDTMVTYTDAAVGMTPAHMDFTNDVFDYGSWENAFFMPKPCMLKFDGTVDYYLDPNDYTKKADGTASDVADMSYQGNAMMEWPIIYAKHWEDGSKKYCLISPTKLDNDFHAYANIGHDGTLGHFYTAIYDSFMDENNRLRSISGQNDASKGSSIKTFTQQTTAAGLNGNHWYIELLVDRLLINDLLYLVAKNTNGQLVYGKGLTGYGYDGYMSHGSSGSCDDKGLFYGDTNDEHVVKVFGMENYWGGLWHRIGGCIYNNHKLYGKLTYGTQDGSSTSGYSNNLADYILLAENVGGTSGSEFISTCVMTQYGLFPIQYNGSSSTYYCDAAWSTQHDRDNIVCYGGGTGCGSKSGISTVDYSTDSEANYNDYGCHISYKP